MNKLSRHDFVEDRLSRLVRRAYMQDMISISRAVSVLWGLEMMLYLVQEGVLKPEKARDTAWAIHRCNKTITEKVAYTFIDQLEDL